MQFSILIYITLLSVVRCSKILIVFPFPAPSHYILGSSLARSLAEDGHDITVVSTFGEKDPPRNGTYRDIVLSDILEEHRRTAATNMFRLENASPLITIFVRSHIGIKNTRSVFEHPKFQELIDSKETFDLVIVETFLNDALNGLGHYFNAPLIKFSTIGANHWINPTVGNPSPPSYIPAFTLSYSSNMKFFQRVYNWIYITLSSLQHYFIFMPAQSKLLKKYLPSVPDLSIVNYNASLVFLNAHESINQAVPLVPNMIPIGGFHVKPAKKLPKDLKDFMDNAKDGVVYFSLGSNIKPSDMPEERKQAILKALGKIKQKVLWKWDEDDLPGKPDNVKLSKWFPQQDILGHPNLKLFITHGGLLSTTETVYHGVPILAFPIFGDQKMNAGKAEMEGFGISLPFSELTEEKLTAALKKVLNDSKYRENVKLRSKLMHDRPIKPMDLAKYWVEYVIRHKGAPHLRVAGVDLHWYIYLSLDVVLFLVSVSISSLSVIYLLIKRICCKKSKVKTKND